MADEQPTMEAVRLAEFAALRTEIQERSARQQTLLGLALTATAVVGGAVLAKHTRAGALLVLPAVCIPLGFLWLDHALNVDTIASYIREKLWIWTPSWEEHIRGSSPRWQVGAFMLPILMVFGGPAIVALVASFSQLHTTRASLWVGDALLVLAFMISAIRFLSRKRREER